MQIKSAPGPPAARRRHPAPPADRAAVFLDAYRAEVRRGKLLPDPAQAAAAERLQEVFDHLTRRSRARAVLRSRLARAVRRRRPDEPDGLWLWGGVGSGKTCLMDLFFHALPLRKKRRLHFHRLMRFVHLELRRLGERRDPLDRIAAQLARRYRVLCLDEFFVADIANAMILGELLDAGPARLLLANRTAARAHDLAARFPGAEACGLAELGGEVFDLVIHATAAGRGGGAPALPDGLLGADAACYDLDYGGDAGFLRWARERGCARARDGLGMLVEQAAESFELWHGVRPDAAAAKRLLRP